MGWQTDVFPLLIVISGGGFTGLFEYSPGPGAGNLIASSAAQAGTDPYGNAYLPGLVTYTTSAPFIAAQLLNNKLQFWSASSQAGPWTANGAAITWLGSSNGMTITPGTGGVGGVVAPTLSLIPRAGTGFADLTGTLFLDKQATPAALGNPQLYGSNAGMVRFVSDSTAGDGNDYGTGRLFQQVNPRSQSFSTVAGGNIGGLSAHVVAGTYFVRGRFIIEWNAAAGTPLMQFAGPAISQYDVSFRTRQSGSSSTANTNALVAAGTVNGTGYNAASPTVKITGAMSAAGVFFDLDVWGMFTFTAAGTLTLQAASDTASDAWIVTSGFWEIQPT